MVARNPIIAKRVCQNLFEICSNRHWPGVAMPVAPSENPKLMKGVPDGCEKDVQEEDRGTDCHKVNTNKVKIPAHRQDASLERSRRWRPGLTTYHQGGSLARLRLIVATSREGTGWGVHSARFPAVIDPQRQGQTPANCPEST
jgi:hypothetical protein